jgi:tetratricopeptide (TPR) repeat protein
LQLDRSYYANPLIRKRIARLNDELKRETSKFTGDSLKSHGLSILEEFKNGLEQSKEPDFETHYNFGMVYKEKELYEDAIEEFQIACKGTSSYSEDINYFNCCKMLGFCFWSLGMLRPAIVWYKRALASPGRSDEEYQEVRLTLSIIDPESNDSDDPNDGSPVIKHK